VSLPRLTIIPAGAGSGKTHTIQERLGRWVVENEVAPDRIVAVTFTEAAAAELRERIGAELLRLDRVEDALRLDQAYISTIHGFGLRVLTEFAFEARTSPQPRLLNEDEQNALIRLAVARTEKADEIMSNLAAYGYVYDFGSKKSAEDLFRDDLLRVVELLRSVGWREHSGAYAEQAAAWITERYGPLEDAGPLSGALRRSVAALLEEFPEGLASRYPDNKSATEALQKDFRNLHAAHAGDALDGDWKLWQSLRDLRQSKRGSALPDGYDDRAAAVMAAAGALPRHPGPLAHARRHIDALLAAGQEVLVHYGTAKREAGLVDYSDMIAMAGQLLREQPAVLATLVSRVDCLVVDEFQDTNPLQFALLWQLAAAGVPTIVVGDLKQAIMGFQGADPRLFDALQVQSAAACEPLTRNWRSQPRLMAFVNAIGPGLFGAEYVPLTPQRADSQPVPLEIVSFPVKAKKKYHQVRAVAMGRRLKALIDDPEQRIEDRRTGNARRPRGGDIAVLCPTHGMIAEYADVLRAQGLTVRVQADGWYTSRVVEIARNALAYLANPADRHAALYLAVTELGSLDLADALRQLMDTGRCAEPLLAKLDQLAAGAAERTVYALVADTLAALGLFDRVAHWPDGEQARANLLRLLAEAGEFMDANREALAHGGFHGAGIQTFLAWLAARVELKDGDRQPEPRVLDEDAIVLTTWHSSKGREWPIVAVCGLDKSVEARLPDLGLGYTTFEDLTRVLERARIEYAPKFAAPETNDQFLAELNVLAETEARRLLYVALTRARDKLVLEWSGYLAGKDGPNYWSILTGSCAMSLGKDRVCLGDAEFPCAVIAGGSEWPEDLVLDAVPTVTELPLIGRRAIQAGEWPIALTPDSQTPSVLALEGAPAPLAPAVGLRIERYRDGFRLDVGLSGVAFGTFLHRCFEVLGTRPDLADKIATLTGVAIDREQLREVTAAVAQFEAWLQSTFPRATVLREWPLLHVNNRGTVVSGTADLIVQTTAGAWIIDHKSDPIDDPLPSYLTYEPQLAAYASALAASGNKVAGTAIHWIRRGEVVLQRLGETIPTGAAQLGLRAP
jgi:ATP-dependent exoDNAse (exonuclease V) beta subunit